MINLVVIVFGIQNKEFIFSKEFIETLNEYNNQATGKIINTFRKFINDEDEEFNSVNDQRINANEIQNLSEQDYENKVENLQQENTSNVIKNDKSINKDSISSMNEMEIDIKNLKGAYTFVNPLKDCIVSSGFGARESKYQNVTGYHTGIDIAAEKGTPIVAAMQGIVEIVSDEGDYGKHVKIRCNNVYTLYAHCSKIFVKKGQIVAEGQKIANVGNTGNSTGPHLHFEIRIDDRFVDPARIIKF